MNSSQPSTSVTSRRRRVALWASGALLVLLGFALVSAVILIDHVRQLGRWLLLGGACLIMGVALGIVTMCSKRYIEAPRRALRAQQDGGPLRVVVVEGFLSRLAFGIISFALPLYAYRLGMSLELIGILLATNTAVAVLLKPLMGMLIDRIGVRASYIVAVALRTCVVLSLVVASNPVHLFVARALHGVAIALRDPSSATVLAALGGKKAVAQRFAWYQTAKTVAGSAGGFVAGMLVTFLAGDYGMVFELSAVLSGLPMLLVLTGLRGPRVSGLVIPRREKSSSMPHELKRMLWPYALLGASMNGTAYLMANLLPVLAVSYMGLSEAAASSLYVFTAVVSLSGPLWGWIADRMSLKLVLGIRAIGNVFSSLIWLIFPTYLGLAIGKVADDVGKAAFRPAWGAVMANVAALDPARRSQTLAMMSTAEDSGELGAPILAGLVWSAFGLPALMLLRAGAGLATELYSWQLARRLSFKEDPGKGETTPSIQQPRRAR